MAALVCLFFAASLRDVGAPWIAAAVTTPVLLPSSITVRDAGLDVVVVDESDLPVPGASVRVFVIRSDTAYFAGEQATGAAGQADFAGLPRGEAWVVVYAPGRARGSTRLVLAAGPQGTLLALHPAAALDVVVVDDIEQPVAGADLTVTTGDPLPYIATSGEDGTARVDRLGPGPYTVRATAPGFDVSVRTVPIAEAPVRIKLTKLGALEVTVLSSEGRPVEGATVLAAGSGLWPARSTLTDEQGLARIAGLRGGVYDLKARLGAWVSETEFAVPLKRGETKPLVLSLELGRWVHVRVTDGDGETAPAIGGAAVVLVEGGLSSFPLEGRTDDEGLVVLGPIGMEGATVGARAKGFVARGAVILSDYDTEARVSLMRGGVLIGDVVDERGYPVDSATLEVVGVDIDGMPIDENMAMADLREGQFELALSGPAPLIPAGELGVMPGPVPGLPHGAALSEPSFGAGPARASEPGGAPAADAWVTRADGTFRLEPVPPGRVHVIVRHPSYVETMSEMITVRSGAESTMHVVMRQGGTLEGRVLDANRRAVAGARVEIADLAGSLERVTYSADDGAFAFAAVPEDVLVSVARPETPGDVAVRQTVNVPPRERKEIEIVLPDVRDAVAIHVTDDRGYPLERVEIRAVALDAAVPLRATLFTNDDGDAELPDAVGLPLRLTLLRATKAPRVVDVDDAPKKLDVALLPGIEAHGVVTSREGRDRVAGAEVVIYARTGAHRARTDADGAFSFTDLAPGRVRINVTHDEYASREVVAAIGADADRGTDLGEIDLAEAGEVKGEVVDPNGDPVAGARVAQDGVPTYLPLGPLPSGIVATDREGRFTLRGVPEGEVTLEAYAADYGRGSLGEIPVRAGRTTTHVTIALPGAPSSREAKGAGSVAVTLGEDTVDGSLAVLVMRVPSGSEAELAGIEPGDLVLAVNGRVVSSMEDTRAACTGPLSEDVIMTLGRDEGTGERATWVTRVRRERVRR